MLQPVLGVRIPV